MFEPPEGTTDFDTDAAAAEHAMEYRASESAAAAASAVTPTSDADVDWGPDPVEENIESLEMQELRLEEMRLKAKRTALERRQATPQVIDSTGSAVDTTAAPAAPAWSGKVITVHDKEIQVVQPSAAAIKYLSIFGFGEAGAARGDFQDFMNRHVSAKSIADIRGWTWDGELSEAFYNDLIKELVTMGSGRPTGPSSPSPRSR
ncbi:hypothetical protein [Nocardia wallacei]|nr:hypothetical protein [Nocardia wallacei]